MCVNKMLCLSIRFPHFGIVLLLLITEACDFSAGQEMELSASLRAANLIRVTLKPGLQTDTAKQKVSTVFQVKHILTEKIMLHSQVNHPVDGSSHMQALEFSLWLDERARPPCAFVVSTQSSAGTLSANVTCPLGSRPARVGHLEWSYEYSTVRDQRIEAPHSNSSPPPVFYVHSRVYKQFTIRCFLDQDWWWPPETVMEWYRDGVMVNQTQALNNGSIVLSDTMFGADLSYQCKARSQSTVSVSHVVHVKPITFKATPRAILEHYTKPLNSHIVLFCNVRNWTSPFPREMLRVIWKKGDRVVENNRTLLIPETGELILRWLTIEDSGYYSCLAQDGGAFESNPLSNCNLTVEGQPGSEPFHDVYPQPRNITTFEGASLTLYCIFSQSTAPVEWTVLGDVQLQLQIATSTDIAYIAHVPKDLNGSSIQCLIKGAGITKTFTFLVEAKPEIISVGSVLATNGEDAEICWSVRGNPAPNITCYKNDEYNINIRDRLAFYNLTAADNAEFQCRASNKLGSALSTTSVLVLEKTLIEGQFIYYQHDSVALHCLAISDIITSLSITWLSRKRDDSKGKWQNVSSKFEIRHNTITVPNDAVRKFDFMCNAWNQHSKAIVTFASLQGPTTLASNGIFKDGDVSYVVAGGIVAIVLLVGLVLLFSYKCHRLRHQIKSTHSQCSTRSLHTPSRLNSYNDDLAPEAAAGLVLENHRCSVMCDLNFNSAGVMKFGSLSSNPLIDAHQLRCMNNTLIDRSLITVQDIIGKGQFGRVHKGILYRGNGQQNPVTVAIKTLKYKCSELEMVNLFLKEAEIMKQFNHVNVLSLVGISEDTDGSPMVLLPYMAKGDLRRYILDDSLDVTVLELLRLGLQVAHGMKYLSTQNFVHRDLACRNCMIDETGCVKVADFGLARDLMLRDYYRDSPGKHPLPVRWMAPECHKTNVFTTMSDVWAYGVLLWELMTRGLTPFQEVDNWNVPAHIVNGARLEQPDYCPDSVYEVMQNCWYQKPGARSAFSEIVQQIDDIVLTAHTGNTDESDRFYLNIELP